MTDKSVVFQGELSRLLVDVAVQLAVFLERVLPQLSDDWWRETVLNNLGWKIHRIWSTDWIKDRHTEGIRFLDVVKNAINNYHEITPPNPNNTTVKVTDFLNVCTQTVSESMHEGVQQKFNTLRSSYHGQQAKASSKNALLRLCCYTERLYKITSL